MPVCRHKLHVGAGLFGNKIFSLAMDGLRKDFTPGEAGELDDVWAAADMDGHRVVLPVDRKHCQAACAAQ